MTSPNYAEHRVSTVYEAPAYPVTRRDLAQPDVSGLHFVVRIRHNLRLYASSSVIEELQVLGPQLDGLDLQTVAYHTTNSLALAGIAKHGGLLSSAALVARGDAVTTGELAVHRLSGKGGDKPLGDVYAKSSPVPYDFTDELGGYAVTFGLGWGFDPTTSTRPSDYGDGIRLGPSVPIESFQLAIADSQYVDQLSEWSGELGTRLPVISQEAAMVMRQCGVRRATSLHDSITH